MRYKLNLIITLLLVTSTIIVSCTSQKKMNSSKSQGTKVENKNAEVTKKPKEDIKSETKATKTETKTETKVVTKEDTKKAVLPVYKVDEYIPLPPNSIKELFITTYPDARDAVWIKKAPLKEYENKNSSDYKVNFAIGDKRHSVLYSENTNVLETKMQILPDQLPPLVLKALKNKYPGAKILYAYTFNSSTVKGSYSAVIKEFPEADERELIMIEDGTFVN